MTVHSRWEEVLKSLSHHLPQLSSLQLQFREHSEFIKRERALALWRRENLLGSPASPNRLRLEQSLFEFSFLWSLYTLNSKVLWSSFIITFPGRPKTNPTIKVCRHCKICHNNSESLQKIQEKEVGRWLAGPPIWWCQKCHS